MKIFKTVWDALRELNSCWLGVAINLLIFLVLVLSQIFPGDSQSWFPPAWVMLTLLFICLLSPVGLALAIRDYLTGERLVAVLGVMLCCWPGMVLLLFLIPR